MGGLFSKPKPPKPVPMPAQDDAASEAARLRALKEQAAMFGRSDTVLSGYNKDKLGTK